MLILVHTRHSCRSQLFPSSCTTVVNESPWLPVSFSWTRLSADTEQQDNRPHPQNSKPKASPPSRGVYHIVIRSWMSRLILEAVFEERGSFVFVFDVCLSSQAYLAWCRKKDAAQLVNLIALWDRSGRQQHLDTQVTSWRYRNWSGSCCVQKVP